VTLVEGVDRFELEVVEQEGKQLLQRWHSSEGSGRCVATINGVRGG
jgi:hypothetical protein